MSVDRKKKLTKRTSSAAIKRILKAMWWPDKHTHLFTPGAGKNLVLYGILKLLNYHYCYREFFSWRRDITPKQFWKLSELKRAVLVWETFFANDPSRELYQLPGSEGMRAVCTILTGLGQDPNEMSLDNAIEFFDGLDVLDHHDHILKLAKVTEVTGTNNPFDRTELEFYQSGAEWHPAFSSALRLDDLVLYPKAAFKYLRKVLDYDTSSDFGKKSFNEARRFVRDWLTGGILPRVRYVGTSFPPDFAWNKRKDIRLRVLEDVVLKVCKEVGVPVFFMPEPIRGLNPDASNAGDYLGKMDSVAYGHFVHRHQDVDIWTSPLNFSSQYEVSALGCVEPHQNPWSTWWYNHQPDLTQRLTRMRMEMAGLNSWFFNSDARVLEHLYSKWEHWRQELETILIDYVGRVIDSGYTVTEEGIEAHVKTMFDTRRLNSGEWRGALASAFPTS
jgi:hypothetical protein